MSHIKYDRQIRIPNWDQQTLNKSSVAVIGAGALGNHLCLGLIGLGIGTIKIYDFDTIEPHNLNRQSLFCESDIGKNKAETLAERLLERNSSIFIVGIDEKIEDDTVESILTNIDVVIDCVDLIYVRRILNRFCLRNDIPFIHGGISWMGGQTGIFTRRTPCINCIFPKVLQDQEKDIETSCTRKPEPSLVYTSQIIAGIMVYFVRRVLMPLPDDLEIPMGVYKVDFRFHPPFYFEPISRKYNCECVEILKDYAPEILKEESTVQKKQQQVFNQEILDFLKNNNKK